MVCYIYNRETSLEIYATTIYQALRELNYDVKLTDTINIQDTDLYIILGGQYLLDIPQRYLILQTIPTSYLTLVSKVEAYWMDTPYIKLLENALEIWDVNQENVKVWQEYYKFTHAHYLEFAYSSSINEKVSDLIKKHGLQPLPPSINKQNAFVVVGDERADKWMRSLNKSTLNNINLTLRPKHEPFQLIASLKSTGCTAIVLADYENTCVDIALCYGLRYNGVNCIVEQTRDSHLNQQLKNIGCYLVPWIRLAKHFRTTLQNINQSNTQVIANKVPKKPLLSSTLNPNLLSLLEKCPIDSEKKKGKHKKKKQQVILFNREAIVDVNYELLEDGGIALKLGEVPDSDLPVVTICTPTGNRRTLFSLAIRNFMSFIYPEDKLRWNILDDGEKSMSDIIPRDYRINYNFIGGRDTRLSVAEMRNQLVETSQSDYIVYMDDDDYYPPESILARVKALLKYQDSGVECVGCRDVASYDLKQGLCAICSNGEEYLTESSLAFTKNFWLTRPFRNSDRTSEYRYFLEYRQQQMRTIPFQFVTIALTHGNNTTGGVRDLGFYQKWKPSEDWEATKNSILNVLDEDTQDFLNVLKKLVCQ